MKKYIPFIAVLGVSAIYFFMSKAKAVKSLKVYFQTLKFDKVTGFRIPPIYAVFRIVNPTDTSLSVDSIAGNVTVNNKLLATIQNLNKIEIAGRSEILYPIKIQAPVLSTAFTILDLIKTPGKMKVAFDGTVNAGNVTIDVEQSIITI
jgi:LEA14-like dessication related protein